MLLEYAARAPQILRQRLVDEGYPAKAIAETEIKKGLPVQATSGAHFYACEKPLLFFGVDIYTCKQFDPEFVKNQPPARRRRRRPRLLRVVIARYTLNDADLYRLSRRLLAEQPPFKVGDALVVYWLEGTDELFNLAWHIEREVFEERFGNDDGQMRQIYGLCEDVSTFVLVMDRVAQRPVGALRSMRSRADLGFLTFREAGEYAGVTASQFRQHHGLEVDWVDKTVDWGTLAVPKPHRVAHGHLLAAMLFRAGQARATTSSSPTRTCAALLICWSTRSRRWRARRSRSATRGRLRACCCTGGRLSSSWLWRGSAPRGRIRS
ncbi:hypothetical protein PG994_005136 [Apiospora phragmitis]|uniref:Uncharacterized protein n=1 Tax=Apiospora phragmitis TaxID=2905665 RepID=A0ABR1VSP8_9PEZI